MTALHNTPSMWTDSQHTIEQINCFLKISHTLYVKEQQQQQSFNGLFSRTTWVSRYQKGKTNLDFTGARDSEWQWHQLGQMQVCTSLQTDNHASTPPLCFLQAGCPSCCPTNSVKALKALPLISAQSLLTFSVSI